MIDVTYRTTPAAPRSSTRASSSRPSPRPCPARAARHRQPASRRASARRRLRVPGSSPGRPPSRPAATGAVTGVDLSPDMLEVAMATPAGGAPIEWRQADAASLPLPDASYQVALCQMGLMFMADKAGALAELHRVLAPGGRVILNTPGRIQPLFEVMERAIIDHVNPDLGAFVSAVFSMHDPDELAALLRKAGFETVASKEYSAQFILPPPAEFLWSYINLTPMGPLVAQAPEEAKAAMERQVIEAWSPHVVGGRVTMDQPMALAWGNRT